MNLFLKRAGWACVILILLLQGCAHFSSSHTYGVRFINHSDRIVSSAYIHIGSYKGLAGGGAMPGEGGGSVALLGLRKFPKRAYFRWKAHGLRTSKAELIIPSLPKPPENLGTYCCDLVIHILPDQQVRATVVFAYVDLEGNYQELINEGPIVTGEREEKFDVYY